jgi:hypothetical protein
MMVAVRFRTQQITFLAVTLAGAGRQTRMGAVSHLVIGANVHPTAKRSGARRRVCAPQLEGSHWPKIETRR